MLSRCSRIVRLQRRTFFSKDTPSNAGGFRGGGGGRSSDGKDNVDIAKIKSFNLYKPEEFDDREAMIKILLDTEAEARLIGDDYVVPVISKPDLPVVMEVKSFEEFVGRVKDQTENAMKSMDWEGHYEKYLPDINTVPKNIDHMDLSWSYFFYPPTGYPESFNLRRKGCQLTVHIREFGFNDEEFGLFRKICGPRYNLRKKLLKLTSQKHETPKENCEVLKIQLSTLVDEIKKACSR